MGRRTSSGIKAGQAAVLSASAGAFFFLASLVLQEQLLHDPTHPYTWLPPSLLPPSPRGFPGEEQEKRGWGGELPESHWFPHLSTWQLAEARRAVSVGEAALSRRSPKDSRPGLGERRRGWFVRNMVCLEEEGGFGVGVALGPLVRGTELSLEILG